VPAHLLIWDFGVFSSGIEGNPTVFYRLMPGSTAQTNKFHTFYLQQRQDNGFTWADIKVNHPLDYETIKEYNLTIRVEVSTAQRPPIIRVEVFLRTGAYRCLCTRAVFTAAVAIDLPPFLSMTSNHLFLGIPRRRIFLAGF